MSPSTATRRWIVAAATAVAATLAVAVPSAHADAFGQVATWGAPGTADGQFYKATEMGVDPTDNSVYVVDQNTAGDAYRLQKFTATGQVKATLTIPRPLNAGNKRPLLKGVVVDAARNRVYLLQYRAGLYTPLGANVTEAEKILVLSTDDTGGTLHAPADLPTGELPVPDPTTTSALVTPTAIDLDPVTHDLVILAQSTDSPRRVVVQRISSAGIAGTRFTDTASTLGTGSMTFGLAAAADGGAYVRYGNFNDIGSMYRVDSAFSALTRLGWTDLDGPATREGWKNPSTLAANVNAGLGPQLAFSPDRGTLYWAEEATAYSTAGTGDIIVRGFSVGDTATKVVYGGGTDSCRIKGRAPAIAAGKDGMVFVLDPGNYSANPPTFGQRLIAFGPGGTGCPAPTASFKIGATSDDTVTVQKGATVTFDASGSDLHGATPTELHWDLDGTGTFATVVTGSPAALTTTLVAKKAGTFTIGLKMKVSGSTLGDPPVPPVKTLKVVSPPPTASFTASPSSPKPDQAVTFDASASVDPTGSEDATPSNDLKSYTWEFGDGQTQTTTTPTVTHAFGNGATSPLARTVKLVVTNHDDVDSAAVTRTVNVQGQPVVTQPPPDTTTDTTPVPPPTTDTTTPPPPKTVPVDPPKNTFTAPKAKVKGTKITLPLTLPGAGRLAVAATIKVKSKTVAYFSTAKTVKGGQGTVTVTPSAKAKAALKKAKGKKTKVAVKITFTPTGGKAFSRTVTVSVKG